MFLCWGLRCIRRHALEFAGSFLAVLTMPHLPGSHPHFHGPAVADAVWDGCPRCKGSRGLAEDPLLSLGGIISSDVAEGHRSSSFCRPMCCLALLTAALQLAAWLTVLPAMRSSAFTLLIEIVSGSSLLLNHAAYSGSPDSFYTEPSMRGSALQNSVSTRAAVPAEDIV